MLIRIIKPINRKENTYTYNVGDIINAITNDDLPIGLYFRYHTHNLLYDIFMPDEVEVIKED